MPVKMEVMALTIEPTKSERELVTEGILNLLIRSDIGFCEIETVFELEKSSDVGYKVSCDSRELCGAFL